MKLFVFLGVLAGLYTFVLMHTTDMVLAQTQQLNQTYQYVGKHADQLAGGHPGQ